MRILVILLIILTFGGTCLQVEGSGNSAVGEPQKLTKLRHQYELSLKKTKQEEVIQEKYLKLLAKLQDDYTRQNEIEAATAVREEMGRIVKLAKGGKEDGETEGTRKGETVVMDKGEEGSVDDLRVWLEGREIYWKGRSGDIVIRFKGDTLFVIADGRQIMERRYNVVSSGAFEFVWGSADVNIFRLQADKSNFTRHIKSVDKEYVVKVRNR